MWNFASNCIAGSIKLKNDSLKHTRDAADCSDDEASTVVSRREGLECPICWQSFNIVENIPYVLWCGHTLCKNCILGLQWAFVNFPTLPIQLPLFIACPWCNMLSLRFVYNGNLKLPRKNFFLLWMLESINGDRTKSHSSLGGDHQPAWQSCTKALACTASQSNLQRGQYVHHSDSSGSNHDHNHITRYRAVERLRSSLCKCLVFFVLLTAKFPLVVMFFLIIFYAIPACATILVLFMLITIVFALPSFLILYFSYPSLDWLVQDLST